MKRIFIVTVFTLSNIFVALSQGFEYSEKEDLGNGLFKVKSGNFYGIIDRNDNVIASVEYQNIQFKEGKALLTKDDRLWGIIDSIGIIEKFNGEYKVHTKYKYVSEGFIPVSSTNKNQWTAIPKWGYINSGGIPYKLSTKIKGVKSIGKKGGAMFDDVTPFVNGIASIYINKRGWKQIDTDGKERYILEDKKAIFRSSVYKGECIIATEDGIKQYQENEKNHAVVKRILSNTASLIDTTENKVIFKEGVLVLDSLRRVIKYTNGNDSIIFIERPKKVIFKESTIPADTISLEENLKISLTSKNLKANSKGRAYTEVKIRNILNVKLEAVSVVIECSGVTREWDGDLEANSEINLSFNVPAKFSAQSIKRNIVVGVTYKNNSIEQKLPITINRYSPVRSR